MFYHGRRRPRPPSGTPFVGADIVVTTGMDRHIRNHLTPRLVAASVAVVTMACGAAVPTAPSAPPIAGAVDGGQSLPAATSSSTAADGLVAACTADTRITDLRVNANMAAPKLEIDPVFDAGPAPFEVEVQRLKNGTWLPWETKASTGGSMRVLVEVWFDQTYRVRARLQDCDWGGWVEKAVGARNVCGHCGQPAATVGTLTLAGAIN